MNNRAVTLSLLMAIIGVLFVQSYVQSIEEEQRKRFGTEVLVLKASRDIKEQETILETMVTLEKVPKKFLEPAAVYFDKGDDEDAPEPDEKTKALTIREVVGSVATITASQSMPPAVVSTRVAVTDSARTPLKIRLRSPWAN